MSGPCCGSAPRYNRDSKWYCSECDGFVGDSEKSVEPDYTYGWMGYNPSTLFKKKCTCGSTKTYGADATHADYCDIKK